MEIGYLPSALKILTGLTIQRAHLWEIGLIDVIGRKELGTGPF